MAELTNEELNEMNEMMLIESYQEQLAEESAEKEMIEDFKDFRIYTLEQEVKELKEKLLQYEMLDEMPDDILYGDYDTSCPLGKMMDEVDKAGTVINFRALEK